jgi:hypothetical protein
VISMARINVPVTVEAKQAKDEITAFNKEMRHTQEVYQLTAKEMEASGNAMGKLEAQYSTLKNQQEIQNSITEKNNIGLRESKKVLEEKQAALEAANIAYEQGKTSLSNNNKELKELEKSLKKAKAEWDIAGERVVKWSQDLEKSEIKSRIFEATMKNVADSIDNAGNTAKASTSNFTDMFTAMAAADLVISGVKKGISGISNYLSQASASAEQWSVVQGQLAHVMGNTMEAAQGQVDAIIELAEAQQRLGVVSRATQISGAQELSTYLQKTESLQTLIPLMNDMLAQQYGINASQQNAFTIATMLGRVLDGQVGALSRYGYRFDEAQARILKFGTESERVAMLVDVISASVGGMNEALGKTDVGRQAQLNMILQETQQRIGEVYNALKAEVSAEMLPAMESMFTDILRLVEENKDSISNLMGIITGLVTFLVDNSKAVVGSLAAIGVAVGAMKIQSTVTALGAWSAATLGLNASKLKLTTTIKALTVAMAANPIFAAGVAIAGTIAAIGAAVNLLSRGFNDQSDEVRRLSGEYNRLEAEISETERKLETIKRRIKEINEQDSISAIDEEELERLERAAKAAEIILETARNEAFTAGVKAERIAIDLIGDAPERLTANIKAYQDVLNEAKRLYAALNDEIDIDWIDLIGIEAATIQMERAWDEYDRLVKNISSDRQLIDDNRDALNGLTAGYEDMSNAIAVSDEYVEKHTRSIAEQHDELGLLNSAYEEASSNLQQNTNIAQEASQNLATLRRSYADGSISGQEYVKALQAMLAETEKLAASNPELASQFQHIGNTIRRELATAPEHLENLQRATSEMSREVDVLRRALSEQNEEGELSANTTLRLIDLGYAAALSFDAETGAARLNTEAMVQLTQARIQALIAEQETARIELTGRMREEVNVVQELTRGHLNRAAAMLYIARAQGISMDATRAEISAIDAQIAVLQRLKESAGVPLPTSNGRTSRDGEREEEDARRARLTAWENVINEREEISRAWIDRERFYNRLSAEETVAANERVIAYLREHLEDVENQYWMTDEERLNIRKNILQKIDRYERQHWTSMRELQQEGEVDEARAAQRRTDALQREIDRAESDAEKYRAYGAMREALQTQLYATLEEISSRFWLSEREKLHAAEDAHIAYTQNIERIEQRMQTLRLQRLNEQATQWRTAEFEQLDAVRRRIDDEHRLKRDALNRELEAIRGHFAALDAEEKRWERGRSLQNLLEEENVWANAATQSGQERLRNIRRQIEDLQRQEEREMRTSERQRMEQNIRSQITANDANRTRQIEEIERQREALQEKYEEMKNAAEKLAEQTQVGLMEAGENLADGLKNMYEELDKNIDSLTTKQLNKARNMAANIMQIFAQTQAAIAKIGFGAGGTSISNTDNSRNVTLHSVNNFHGSDQRAMSQAWNETLDISLRHYNLKV